MTTLDLTASKFARSDMCFVKMVLLFSRGSLLPAVGSSFLAHIPRVRLVRSSGVTDRTKTATEVHPLSLFSLLVTIKLKPEIISQEDRELIVNMTILETSDET